VRKEEEEKPSQFGPQKRGHIPFTHFSLLLLARRNGLFGLGCLLLRFARFALGLGFSLDEGLVLMGLFAVVVFFFGLLLII
jgi:hypothetical protein